MSGGTSSQIGSGNQSTQVLGNDNQTSATQGDSNQTTQQSGTQNQSAGSAATGSTAQPNEHNRQSGDRERHDKGKHKGWELGKGNPHRSDSSK